MPTVVEEFFQSLGGRAPLLRQMSGVIRFDVGDGAGRTRWLVVVERGHVSVSRRNRAADCVIRTDEQTLARILTREDNPMAAYLRGALEAEGDMELLLLFQRMFTVADDAEPAKG